MLEVEGFILAGGASRRMGRDKARLRLGGETFVARAARALAALTPCVRLVSARPDAAEFGLPVVADVYRDCGALGGLHAALAACRAPWAAVVSCDLPFVTGAYWLRLAVFAEADAPDADAPDAVVPFQPDGRAQPLCALYARAACLPAVERMLRAGELRPRRLLEQVRARRVAPAELRALPEAARLFTNVNTPEEYEAATNEG
ncbi:MAG TPA: molybdenum cofactor guanylyltransferase [Pyrinomonadaceae bacterium]|jgi:molybdopterin-guanine dinucleotide biosynthesis protein A